MPITATSLSPLLQVYDMRKSVAWYRDVLGFEVVHTYEPEGHFYWAQLQLGGATLMLNSKYEDDQRPPQPENTPRGDVTLYISCPNVDRAYEHIQSKGWPVEAPKVTYYCMKQLHIKDPDGFELCFQQPAQG